MGGGKKYFESENSVQVKFCLIEKTQKLGKINSTIICKGNEFVNWGGGRKKDF